MMLTTTLRPSGDNANSCRATVRGVEISRRRSGPPGTGVLDHAVVHTAPTAANATRESATRNGRNLPPALAAAAGMCGAASRAHRRLIATSFKVEKRDSGAFSRHV